ncbi:MAG: hypothetical protein J5965_26110 [Aeriscardovia sp.]|nr:hypothetical protein [Aeriscardovia sp.]
MPKLLFLYRKFLLFFMFLLFLLYSCTNRNAKYKNTQCAELAERAEAINADAEKKDIKVEYIDSIYRMIQFMDDDIAEKYSESLGNHKLFLYKQFILSKNRVHRLLVENKVYFEYIIQSKNGDIISRTILTPYEIANAMDGVPFSYLRCLELEKEAIDQNAKAERLKGMTVKVEYFGDIYRITQTVDERIIPSEKVIMSYGNEKSNMIASLSSTKDKEREHYNQMVDYRVTFEHIVKSKQTGNVIVRTIMTPDEIEDALKHKITKFDQIKINVNSIKQTLPREMEAGYTIADISFDGEVVTFEIVIDEGMKTFDEATIIRSWSKENQAITLFDLTTGQTFYSIVANVPIGVKYHFTGSKSAKELTIDFNHEEVVKYNNQMIKILENH